MIRAALTGRRVLVTGATGFLGTAVVERLLRSVPGCEVAVLVRPGQQATAAQRAWREVVRNDCFDRLRTEIGDRFQAELERRLVVVPGDVARDGLGLTDEGRQVLAGCHVAVHAAASVSFDAPLDAAVEVNLLGPCRVAAALAETGSPAHLIAVSTAYVAGSHKGDAREAPLDSRHLAGVGWRDEVAAARRTRSDLDAESRRPQQLERFARLARAELGAAGTPLLAERAERARADWVHGSLIDAGRARARALGWPDAYAYTKALGEVALCESRGPVPVTIVRPSVIESALAEPHPGWIRGFRMAEPLIISYARGLLEQFPGIPEGVIDVIPVDLVVSAILAAAAAGPDPAGPSVYQVASGQRNPLRYRQLVDLVHSWFKDHPLYDAYGQPIDVPELSFPRRGRVQRQLERTAGALRTAERVVSALPLRGRPGELQTRLEQRREQVERAHDYVQLYGSYAETEALFRVDRLLHLLERLDDEDRTEFCFDPAAVDWPAYLHEVHLPSVVARARVRTSGGRRAGGDREERARRAVLSPDRQLAVFDFENTLIASNVVESYAWLATRRLRGPARAAAAAALLAQAPGLWALDRRDRGDFLRSFYRRYRGAPEAQVRADAWELWSSLLLAKAFPAGLARVRQHRRAGHRTMLLTGALGFVVEPLRPLFDDIVCANMTARDGRLTGELEQVPPTGEARGQLIVDHAQSLGLSIAECVAYADSTSDLPLLETVGYPVAVNPEAKLAAVARRRGWPVEHWARAAFGSAPLLPIGPLPARAAPLASLAGLRDPGASSLPGRARK
jgi:fatty acyl-CoA reductase